MNNLQLAIESVQILSKATQESLEIINQAQQEGRDLTDEELNRVRDLTNRRVAEWEQTKLGGTDPN